MSHNILKIAAMTASLSVATPFAYAASWTPTEKQNADAPRVIYTETDTGAALLACNSDGKLKATLSNDKSDFAGRMTKSAKYHRGVDVALTIGDKVHDPVTWKLLPAIDSIFSDNHASAAKLYNAVVRGDTVTATVDGEPYVTITLPGVDDTFKAFARTCKAT